MALTKTNDEGDIETGHRSPRASSSAARTPPNHDDTNSSASIRHECLDGSKSWHSICLGICTVLANLGFAAFAIVFLTLIGTDDDYYDDNVKAQRYRWVFAIFLLITGVTGLIAAALYHREPRGLPVANLFYFLTLIVYLPIGFVFTKSAGAVLFCVLMLVPIFSQSKLLYLLRDPPDNSRAINHARARAIAAHRTDCFDGSQQWQYPCMRITAVLVNLAYLVFGIIWLVDLVGIYQERTSNYITYYQNQPLTEGLSYRWAFGMTGSLLYVSVKGTLGAVFLQRHLLALACMEYPFISIFLVSIGTYFNLPQLWGVGLSLVVPPVLLGKLYMFLVYGAEAPSNEIPTTDNTTSNSRQRRRSPANREQEPTRSKLYQMVLAAFPGKQTTREEPTETAPSELSSATATTGRRVNRGNNNRSTSPRATAQPSPAAPAQRSSSTTTPSRRDSNITRITSSTTKRPSQPYPSLNESSRRESIRSNVEEAKTPRKTASPRKNSTRTTTQQDSTQLKSPRKSTRRASFDEDLPSPPSNHKKRPSQSKE